MWWKMCTTMKKNILQLRFSDTKVVISICIWMCVHPEFHPTFPYTRTWKEAWDSQIIAEAKYRELRPFALSFTTKINLEGHVLGLWDEAKGGRGKNMQIPHKKAPGLLLWRTTIPLIMKGWTHRQAHLWWTFSCIFELKRRKIKPPYSQFCSATGTWTKNS